MVRRIKHFVYKLVRLIFFFFFTFISGNLLQAIYSILIVIQTLLILRNRNWMNILNGQENILSLNFIIVKICSLDQHLAFAQTIFFTYSPINNLILFLIVLLLWCFLKGNRNRKSLSVQHGMITVIEPRISCPLYSMLFYMTYYLVGWLWSSSSKCLTSSNICWCSSRSSLYSFIFLSPISSNSWERTNKCWLVKRYL